MVAFNRTLGLVAASVMVAVPAVGCAATGPESPERIVFATSRTTFQDNGASPTKTILNYSNLLHNTTGSRIRLLSIRLVFPSRRDLEAITIKAYSFAQDRAGVFEGAQGNLETICPQQFRPIPLSDVTVEPHSYSRWNIVLSFTVPHPVHIPYMEMNVQYEANDQQGWQPLYLNVKFAAISASKDPALVQPYYCTPKRRSSGRSQ